MAVKLFVKLNDKTAKKGGSVVLKDGLESPLSLTIKPGTKNNECVYKGKLRVVSGNNVTEEDAEVYASVSWFKWWFIPAAVVLLIIFCNLDCGGKSDKSKTKASTTEAGSSAENSEENYISYEEAEALAHQVYECADPASVPRVSNEKFDEIMIGSDAITLKYLVDGYVPEDKIQDVLEEKWDYMKQFVENGTAVKVERTLLSCTLTFANELKLVYSTKFKDCLSGSDPSKDSDTRIIRVVKAADSSKNHGLDLDFSLTDLTQRYENYVLEDTVYGNEIKTIQDIIDIFQGVSILIWDGHGTEGSELVTNIKKEDFINDPLYKVESGGSFEDTGYFCINVTFIKDYLDSNAFQGAFIYLGTCYSANYEIFAKSFLDKGAEVVVGNTSPVYKDENREYREALFGYMMDGMSVIEAKACVEDTVFSDAQHEVRVGEIKNNIFHYDKNHVKIIGNTQYTFSDELEYYLIVKKYRFTGLVQTDSDGRHYLMIDPSIKIHGIDQRCSQIYFPPQFDQITEKLEGEQMTCCDIIFDDDGRISFTENLFVEYKNPSTLMKYLDYYEIIEADPGKDVEIIEVKLYNKLVDFLGEPFEKVEEYYGVPEGGIGMDENGACLSYLINGNYFIFAEVYESTGVINEIQVIFEDKSSSDILICPGVSSQMPQAQVHSALSEYHSEAHVTSDALTVQATYKSANVFISWNPSSTSCMSFVRLENIRKD